MRETVGCGPIGKRIWEADACGTVGRQALQRVKSGVSAAQKELIHSLVLDDLAARLAERGHRPYRAKQVIDWLYAKRAASYEAMTDLPQALRAQLAEEFALVEAGDRARARIERHDAEVPLSAARREFNRVGADPRLTGALRRALGSADDCVSSQVGCAYGCKFCASGLDGWTRNLEAGEIVQQLIAVEEKSGEKIDNVVFMGMGEPLANLKNLMRAIRIINAPWGLGSGRGISRFRRAGSRRKFANWPRTRRSSASRSRCTARPTKCGARSCQ
jgi:23S rRNA (adenine2503-C2)-methyltransferase